MPPLPPIVPPAWIGMIGGGQLARMMTQKAKKLGYRVCVLDPHPHSPAGQLADEEIVARFDDVEALRRVVERSAVTTYDIETIDVSALRTLESEGRLIRPSAGLLALIQDKYEQRRKLATAGIPQPQFQAIGETDLDREFKGFGYPLVQKARTGGYDGRGVAVIRDESAIDQALRGPSYVERCVDIEKELAVVAARSVDGQVACYPLVEMVFDPRANLLDLLLAPARVPPEVERRAREVALAAVECLDGVGVFGIELFWTKSGEVLLNEVAPRPHNSGHFTYEACVTSQFEQHIRAVTGLPLGSVEQMRPAAMINLLGDKDGGNGPATIDGFAQAMGVPGALVHIYGKAETRPFRKMGHVTVLATDLEEALEKAMQVRGMLRIHAEGER